MAINLKAASSSSSSGSGSSGSGTINSAILYEAPKYPTTYYIASSVHEDSQTDVLNTGLYYLETNTVIYAIVNDEYKSIDIGYGFPTETIEDQSGTKYKWTYLNDTYIASRSTIADAKSGSYVYPWIRISHQNKFYYWSVDDEAKYNVVEVERGSIPTVLKKHLDYTPWSQWTDEKNRFASISFGGTIHGSDDEEVSGTITRSSSSLVIKYTKNSSTKTLTFTKDDFWDKVIPTRLVVAIQGAGGSGGGKGGSGGGSGSFWLGVMNLDNQHSSWKFTLGKPGSYVTGPVKGQDGTSTILSRGSGLMVDSIIVYAGKGGKLGQITTASAGGAGGSKPKLTIYEQDSGIRQVTRGLWEIASLSGLAGGNSGYTTSNYYHKDPTAGTSSSAATYYLTDNTTAKNYPRNQYDLLSYTGGTVGTTTSSEVSIAGGGAASYNGHGGAGGNTASSYYNGYAGTGFGSGGGGAGYDPVAGSTTSMSGSGRKSFISFYY